MSAVTDELARLGADRRPWNLEPTQIALDVLRAHQGRGAGEALVRLEAATELVERAKKLYRLAGVEARAAGHSWEIIAEAAGVDRNGARYRFDPKRSPR